MFDPSDSDEPPSRVARLTPAWAGRDRYDRFPDPGCQEPDPAQAGDQVEFRGLLRELMKWAGCGSLAQLQRAAARRHVAMPVSTADRALNADRLPTGDFVRRFVLACGASPARWLAVRDSIADRRYARAPRRRCRCGLS